MLRNPSFIEANVTKNFAVPSNVGSSILFTFDRTARRASSMAMMEARRFPQALWLLFVVTQNKIEGMAGTICKVMV